MATLTIRNLSEDLVQRIKSTARNKGHSMEQEVRKLLEARYAKRAEVLARVRARWNNIPETHPDEIKGWREEGRP